MKKQHAPANRLAFSKEKIASLSPADLEQLHGGQVEAGQSPAFSRASSNHGFTCCACTGGGIADE